MKLAGKFNRNTNRGTKLCRLCKTRKQEANIDHSTGLCQNFDRGCFELAGLENSHSDNKGAGPEWDHEVTPSPDCPTCHPELEALYTSEGRAAAKEVR